MISNQKLSKEKRVINIDNEDYKVIKAYCVLKGFSLPKWIVKAAQKVMSSINNNVPQGFNQPILSGEIMDKVSEELAKHFNTPGHYEIRIRINVDEIGTIVDVYAIQPIYTDDRVLLKSTNVF